MPSVNRVQILGRLGKNPEIQYTQNNVPVCSMSVCTDESQKQADGTYVQRPEWHRIVAWQRTAENAAKYLKKGSLVYVDGKLQTRKYTDKNGIERYSTEIIALNIQFCDRKEERAQVGGSESSMNDYFNQPQGNGYPPQGQPLPGQPFSPAPSGMPEDQVPF